MLMKTINIKKSLITLLLCSGLIVSGLYSFTPTAPPAEAAGSASNFSSDAESSNQVEVTPLFWHLVIRQALTKAGCENIRRLMPNRGDLKCLGAGPVWVLIPKNMGW